MKNEKIWFWIFGAIGAIYTVISIYDSYHLRKITDNPNWVIEVKFNESNYLIDKFFIESKNDNVNIQFFEIYIKGKDKIEKFRSKNNVIYTERIKSELVKFLNDDFDLKYKLLPFQYYKWSIPIAIIINYEYLGEIKEDIRIYEYSFRTYIDKEEIARIKSDDIFFIKKVNSNQKLIRELIFANRDCCLSSDFDEFKLYFEYIEAEEKYSDFDEFFKMNLLPNWHEEVTITDLNDSSYVAEKKFYNFSFMSDSTKRERWDSLYKKFEKNKLRYNFKFNSNLDSLNFLLIVYDSGYYLNDFEYQDSTISDRDLIEELNQINFFEYDSNYNLRNWMKFNNGMFEGMIEYIESNY